VLLLLMLVLQGEQEAAAAFIRVSSKHKHPDSPRAEQPAARA